MSVTWICRRIHRTADMLNRLGWWLRDPAEHRLNRRLKAEAAALTDGRITERTDG